MLRGGLSQSFKGCQQVIVLYYLHDDDFIIDSKHIFGHSHHLKNNVPKFNLLLCIGISLFVCYCFHLQIYKT